MEGVYPVDREDVIQVLERERFFDKDDEADFFVCSGVVVGMALGSASAEHAAHPKWANFPPATTRCAASLVET